jgi:hypothetical protein
MNINALLPHEDSPSGPKENSKSRNTTSRKKDEPHPRFA